MNARTDEKDENDKNMDEKGECTAGRTAGRLRNNNNQTKSDCLFGFIGMN